jgi:hypothetical protein
MLIYVDNVWNLEPSHGVSRWTDEGRYVNAISLGIM